VSDRSAAGDASAAGAGESAATGAGVPVALRTLGCKVNRVESEDIAADLIGRGAFLAPEDEAAVIVVNTCTVTGEADAKARKAVRHALRAARAPVVVVTGCLAAVDREALEALGDRVIVEPAKELVPDRVADLLGLHAEPHAHAVRAGEGFRTRAMLKVEDGCDNFCSYCIVPHARGVPRGVPLATAVAEAESLVAAGAPEIVLTGINLGRYRDETAADPTAPGGVADLATLARAVAATGIARLRLSSIEPPDLTPRLLGVLAETPAVCPHLHVPLQSGSDAVLGAMNRAYTAEQYAGWIEAARAALPGLALTTDVVAGFPGETAEHAAETLAFVERIGFAKLHVFRYSERPGTPAATMPGSVLPEVRAERAAALRELGDRMRAAYVAARQGSETSVLIERVQDGAATGTTEDYLRVRLPAASCVPGEIVSVILGDGAVQVLP